MFEGVRPRLANALRRPVDRRSAVVATVLGIALFCASASRPTVGLFDDEQVGDTPAYAGYGDAIFEGEVPYRDFYVEYPPGALPVFVVPAAGDADGYANRFKVVALALGAALVACVVWALAIARAATGHVLAAATLVGVAPAVLGPVFLINFDFWPAALAAAAVAATAWRRAVLGGVLLGLAVAAKFFALVLSPFAFLYVGGRAAWRGALAAVAAVVVVFAPFAVLAPGAIGNNLLNLVRRPLQIESLGASILLAAHQLGAYRPTVNSDYNSQNLGGALAAVVATASGLVALSVVAAIVVAFARGPRPVDRFFVACAAALTALVAFGKILSPQFLVWLVPLVALVPSASAYGLLLAAMALTHVWFPSRYGQLLAFGDVSWIVLLRNLALLGLLAVLSLRLVRKRAPP
jgi:Glycosyltransferase family 87